MTDFLGANASKLPLFETLDHEDNSTAKCLPKNSFIATDTGFDLINEVEQFYLHRKRSSLTQYSKSQEGLERFNQDLADWEASSLKWEGISFRDLQEIPIKLPLQLESWIVSFFHRNRVVIPVSDQWLSPWPKDFTATMEELKLELWLHDAATHLNPTFKSLCWALVHTYVRGCAQFFTESGVYPDMGGQIGYEWPEWTSEWVGLRWDDDNIIEFLGTHERVQTSVRQNTQAFRYSSNQLVAGSITFRAPPQYRHLFAKVRDDLVKKKGFSISGHPDKALLASIAERHKTSMQIDGIFVDDFESHRLRLPDFLICKIAKTMRAKTIIIPEQMANYTIGKNKILEDCARALKPESSNLVDHGTPIINEFRELCYNTVYDYGLCLFGEVFRRVGAYENVDGSWAWAPWTASWLEKTWEGDLSPPTDSARGVYNFSQGSNDFESNVASLMTPFGAILEANPGAPKNHQPRSNQAKVTSNSVPQATATNPTSSTTPAISRNNNTSTSLSDAAYTHSPPVFVKDEEVSYVDDINLYAEDDEQPSSNNDAPTSIFTGSTAPDSAFAGSLGHHYPPKAVTSARERKNLGSRTIDHVTVEIPPHNDPPSASLKRKHDESLDHQGTKARKIDGTLTPASEEESTTSDSNSKRQSPTDPISSTTKGKRVLGALRAIPCLACARSLLSGRSDGKCYDNALYRSGRCYRCACGGSCLPIPPNAVDVAMNMMEANAKENTKNLKKYRAAFKVLLEEQE